MSKTTHEDWHVNRSEFARLLPVLTDLEGAPLTAEILIDELDAVGFFKTKDIEGNVITIRYFWGKED